MESTKSKLFYSILLLIGAFIWGLAFVFQSIANNYLGAYSITFFRCVIAVIVLIPITIYSLKKQFKVEYDNKNNLIKASIFGGILSGIFLALASVFQQLGLKGTSTGKGAFMGSTYIILVPIISFVLFRKKCGINNVIAIIFALIGLLFLCLDNFSFSNGLSKEEIYFLICALCFAFQIISIDCFAPKSNLFLMALIQMITCGIICMIMMFIKEKIQFENVKNCIVPLLYLGILSSGVAYTIKVISQKHINSTTASLLMSLESVFSCLCGVIIYTFYKFTDVDQYLTTYQIIGCVFMFVGVVISQINFNFKKIKSV